jgi:hypothetical protein
MLHIVTWRWGHKYSPDYVERLAAGVARHLKQPHRFVVCAPPEQDLWLTEIPGCLCRLRMFEYRWQREHGVKDGDRLVCLDLDLVVTGPLDPLFDRSEPFVILKGANSANPCPFNGSVMMLKGGVDGLQFLWSTFSLEAVRRVPFYQFPDDQGWLAAKLPSAAGWQAGQESGVYAFHKPGWPGGDDLPADARIVAFPGKRDPSQFTHLPWVREHWGT